MNRLSSLFLSVALLVGLTTAVEAQNVEAEGGDTTVEIDGSVDTGVYRRDNNINTILNGGSSPSGDADNQSAMMYHYTLGVTADVGDRVTGRLEIDNERLDGTGTAANDNLIGIDFDDGENVQLSEAYLKADRFLVENLSLQIGVQGYETDLRGDGNPFFLDLQGSEGITDSRASATEAVLTGSARSDRNLNNDAGGLKLTADINPNTDLDLFWFTVRENQSPVGDDNDEHILGGVLNGSLQDTGSYQLVGTYFQDVATGSAGGTTSAQGIWTLGGGVEYDVSSSANVYGEAYVQGGERDATSDQDTSLAVDLGVAGDVNMFHYDFSGTHVSGDDGSDVSSDDDNEDFVSYEDNDDTMILEDNILGLDVDSNYQKLQAIGGVTGTVIHPDDLKVNLLAAWAQTDEEIAASGGDLDDSLGFETDLTVTWEHSASLDFELGVARLWSGDFWADDGGTDTTSDALDLYTLTGNLNF